MNNTFLYVYFNRIIQFLLIFFKKSNSFQNESKKFVFMVIVLPKNID